MAKQNRPKFSTEQQLAVFYEALNEMDQRLTEIEDTDPHVAMRIPQYIECETDAEDPIKKAVVEFPDSGNVLFVVHFLKGNNVPDDKDTILELLFEDEQDESGETLRTYAYDTVNFLPKKLYPGAHVMIQSWIDDEEDPEDVPDDGYESRDLECVAVLSLGIPPALNTADIEQKLDDLLHRVEKLEKVLNNAANSN